MVDLKTPRNLGTSTGLPDLYYFLFHFPYFKEALHHAKRREVARANGYYLCNHCNDRQ